MKTIENTTVIENNKLIAEFMGAKPIEFEDGTKGHSFWHQDGKQGRYGSFTGGGANYFEYDKGYNDSWDWLMPVVDRIYNLGLDEQENNLVGDITHALVDVNIKETHKAVVKFINEHN